ncbi:MAG: methionyl-tRNA formyltransferase [Oscillospiraceae bacterium]|jgi:methionyl-tRNA formyltransferase|nr:methionyl-tRNA formyltransferase [Oscillospiraceae bacterium]
MRLLFMGTPEFAAVSLRAIADSAEHEIAGVFCQPDRPKGRGLKLIPPPVKSLALSLGLPVFQPSSLRDADTERIARKLNPDVSVVVAYGRLLPQSLIDAPRLGTLNVHASLLPRWRGAAPIQRAIMAGDRVTGVCVQQMRLELDSGDLISSRSTPIAADETYGELYDRLAISGAELLTQTLRSPWNPTPQVGEVTFAPPIMREDCTLDLTRPAAELACQVRALCPKPGASVKLGGASFKIFKARVGGDGALVLPCGANSTLVVEELQAPGGKRMRSEDFLRGNQLNL